MGINPQHVIRYLKDERRGQRVAASGHPSMVHIPPAPLPEVTDTFLNVFVCYVKDPNRFWIRRVDALSNSYDQAIGDAVARSTNVSS